MDDLIAFLRARLDEDAATSRAARRDLYGILGQVDYYDRAAELDETHIRQHRPARVLAEVDAKRQIIELHQPITDPTPPFKDTEGFLCSICTAAGGAMYDQQRGILFTDLTVFPCRTLRLLALPYADHPDYRDTWRP